MTEGSEVDFVFVYGTLKRGECRENCWPHTPESVTHGWVWGELYDTGPFPAMVHGNDRVQGEVWEFPSNVMPGVLAALDAIEGTNQPGESNLYDRKRVGAHVGFRVVQAYAYFFAQPLADKRFRRISPDPMSITRGTVGWPSPRV